MPPAKIRTKQRRVAGAFVFRQSHVASPNSKPHKKLNFIELNE